jgi:hypothetical protein
MAGLKVDDHVASAGNGIKNLKSGDHPLAADMRFPQGQGIDPLLQSVCRHQRRMHSPGSVNYGRMTALSGCPDLTLESFEGRSDARSLRLDGRYQCDIRFFSCRSIWGYQRLYCRVPLGTFWQHFVGELSSKLPLDV